MTPIPLKPWVRDDPVIQALHRLYEPEWPTHALAKLAHRIKAIHEQRAHPDK